MRFMISMDINKIYRDIGQGCVSRLTGRTEETD